MKKQYTAPEWKISVFDAENVVTTASELSNPNADKVQESWGEEDVNVKTIKFGSLKIVI